MKKKIHLLPSGIPLVDIAWGGFYRGGTYLLAGPRKSGRTLLALQYAMESVKNGEVCLYFTSVRPKDLIINAASIDLDLQEYINRNLVIVVKVSPPKNIEYAEDPDLYLTEYINDIKKVVDQYQPNHVVFDELTPFVGFKNIDLLKEALQKTTDEIEERGITSLFVLGEPVTAASKKVMHTISELCTGKIQVSKTQEFISQKNPGEILITPNVGHTEGQFESTYYIEPNKGIRVNINAHSNNNHIVDSKMENKYKSFAEMTIPQETYSLPNIYNHEDFKLILSNQIAFYKTTGKAFTIASIRLDETAEKGKLLTMNQLQNAVRLSTERKDKICTINNKVLVLFTKEDVKDINNFIAKVISNLPNDEPNYLNSIVKFISVYNITIDEEIKNSSDLFEKLLSDQNSEKYRFGYS